MHSPHSTDARPQAAPCTPADLTTHSPSKICSHPRTATRSSRALLPRPRSPDAHPQAAPCIPHRRPSPAPAQRRALPEHFRSPSPHRRTPAGCAMHSSPTSQHIPRRRPSSVPAQRHALPAHFRSPPQRRPASPSVPLRAQKNGTAQWMCDAECLGRPSLRSVIGVGEPRAVRRRCGALAWRVGLRPQPWALRSRRCGRVLRA